MESALTGLSVGFIGSGAMGEALLAGLLRGRTLEVSQLIASDPRREQREALSARYGVHTCADNADALGAELLVIAVKPPVLAAVMRDLKGRLRESQVVISIVAGATSSILVRGLGHERLVRCMPNTPAQIGRGVTVWFATAAVDEKARAAVRAILAAIGRELEVRDERQVALATAVSGSGPAYVFLVMEALVDAAVRLGLQREFARTLVVETMEGAAAFARESGRHLTELRESVTSPGGTTAAALYELERAGLRAAIDDAVQAAFRRNNELESSLEQP